MPRHPMVFECAAFVIAAASFAASPAAQTAQSAVSVRLVAEVESLVAAGEPDRALALALRTSPIVERAANAAQRQALDALIEAADPLVDARTQARTQIAKALLAEAQPYTRKGWHRVSLQLLELAVEFDAAVAGKSHEFVAKRVAANRAKDIAAAAAAADKRRIDVFESLAVDITVGDWTRDKGGYRSPVVSGDSLFLIGASPRHQDARVCCELTLDPSMECWGAILVGAQSADDYFIIEASHDPSRPSVCMTVWHYSRAGLAQLGQAAEFCKAEAVRAPHLIDVRIRDDRIVASIGGLAEVTVDTTRPVHGTVGLFVSGNTPSKVPVMFRNMTIEPLAEVGPTTASDGGPGADFESRFAAIERQREARDLESATLLTRSLLAELVDRVDVDPALVPRAKTLLEDVDPFAEARATTMHESCARLTALAARYDEVARPRAALHVLADAVRLDADAVVNVRSAFAERSLAAAASDLAAPAETAVPGDATETLRWLADAECYGTKARWSRDEAAVFAAPTPRDADATIVSAESTAAAASVSVQLRPSERGAVGVVFGHRSAREYWVAEYTQRDGGRLALRHRSGDSWHDVASGPALLGAAARSGWATLEVTFDDTQLVARIGRAPPISIARPESFAPGRLGLYASALGDACQFRGLRCVPAAAK